MLNRREFCVLSAVAMAAAPIRATGVSLTRQDGGLEVRELREGVWAILGGGGNSLAVKSGDGGILIDTKLPQVATELLEKCSGVLGHAPSMVINTHHHGDHVGSNYQYSANARIVGHANIRPRTQATIGGIKGAINRMASQARRDGDVATAEKLAETAQKLSIDQFAPDDEFDVSHMVELGERRLELTHVGNGHTDNDAIILMPEENIVHMGDLLFHRVHPYMDLTAKSNSTGWRNSVRAALELCDDKTIVIPGHGDLTDRAGLQGQIDYFDRLEEIARKAIQDGGGRDQLVLDEFDDYQSNRGLTNLQHVYDELTGQAV